MNKKDAFNYLVNNAEPDYKGWYLVCPMAHKDWCTGVQIQKHDIAFTAVIASKSFGGYYFHSDMVATPENVRFGVNDSVSVCSDPKEKKHSQGDGFMPQDRYKNNNGDYLSQCEEDFTPEEMRAAYKFTIGKYMSRLGKKDDIEQEVYKIADYSQRWLNYEKRLKEKYNGN